HHGMPWRERDDGVEAALVPAAAVAAEPEERMLRSLATTPLPAPSLPELAARVTAVVDERLELGVRHQRGGDAERRDLDRMGPLLVVEDERLVGRGAEQEGAAGHGDVARTVGRIDDRSRPREIEAIEARTWIAERMNDEREILGVHVLVLRGQRVKVRVVGRRLV